MNIFKSIKRLFFKLKNNDPIHNCPTYLKEGCSFVDGPFCTHPNCSIERTEFGEDWVSCVECSYQEYCSSKNYGLGCYEGIKDEDLV
jgi:hypothetical protein